MAQQYDYEAARQTMKQRQEAGYSVLVTYEDGRYRPFEKRPLDGYDVRFLKNEGVTLKRCRDFIAKLTAARGDVGIARIQICMTQYDYDVDLDVFISAMMGDHALPRIGKDRYAIYDVKHNVLTIYVDGSPVYENDNGAVCRDAVALADSYL